MPIFKKLRERLPDNPVPSNAFDEESVREFCQLILMGEHDEVTEQCVKLLESEQIDLETLLYILSGYGDISNNEGKMLIEQPLVTEEFFLISSDCGAPDLDDFCFYVDGLKKHRNLDFSYEKSKFTEERAMDCWMGELVGQLENLYLLVFGAGSDTYHYLITDKKTGNRLKILYEKIGTEDYETVDFIERDFCE